MKNFEQNNSTNDVDNHDVTIEHSPSDVIDHPSDPGVDTPDVITNSNFNNNDVIAPTSDSSAEQPDQRDGFPTPPLPESPSPPPLAELAPPEPSAEQLDQRDGSLTPPLPEPPSTPPPEDIAHTEPSADPEQLTPAEPPRRPMRLAAQTQRNRLREWIDNDEV